MKHVLQMVCLCLMASVAHAQNPVKVAEIYETHVFAVDRSGQSTGLIPATLMVRSPDADDNKPTVTLEVEAPTTAPLLRLTKLAFPPEYEHVMGGTDEILLDSHEQSSFQRKTQFDVGAIATRNTPYQGGKYQISVFDATGAPATGVQLTIKAGVHANSQMPLGTQTVPASGRIFIQIPVAPVKESNSANVYTYRPYSHHEITATDQSGQKQTVTYPQITKPGIASNTEAIYLALLPRDSTAAAYRGKVLKLDGEPSPEEMLRFTWLELPGRGGMQFFGGPVVTTAPDGTFSFSVPAIYLQQELGVSDLPTSAILNVSASTIGARITTSHDNIIRLQETENIRVQLLAPDGTPLPGLRPNYSLNVSLLTKQVDSKGKTRERNTSVRAQLEDAENAIITLQNLKLPKEFGLEVNGWRFASRHVEKGASAALLPFLQLDTRTQVIGRAVAIEDGAPIAGAYVISSFTGNTVGRFVQMTEEELQNALKQWESGEVRSNDKPTADIKLDNGGVLSSIDAFTKTDPDGRFTLEYEAGQEPKTIHVFTPGRMGASCRLLEMEKPEGDPPIYTLPDVPLPASAMVSVKVVPPDEVPDPFLSGTRPGSSFKFALSSWFQQHEAWKLPRLPLNPTKEQPWTLISPGGWSAPESRLLIPVAAGTTVSVTAYVPNELTIGSATWSDIDPLAPGSTIELKEKQVPLKTPFLVAVKKSDGTPAVGVSVRIDGNLPLTTDKDGNVIGWTSGYVRRIQVMPDNGWDVAAEKNDITIEPGGKMTTVELIME